MISRKRSRARRAFGRLRVPKRLQHGSRSLVELPSARRYGSAPAPRPRPKPPSSMRRSSSASCPVRGSFPRQVARLSRAGMRLGPAQPDQCLQEGRPIGRQEYVLDHLVARFAERIEPAGHGRGQHPFHRQQRIVRRCRPAIPPHDIGHCGIAASSGFREENSAKRTRCGCSSAQHLGGGVGCHCPDGWCGELL